MAETLVPSQVYRKYFVPLESNPEVFTELVHRLGVHESLEFEDVLSLDDPDLLSFLPRPVYALILVFPTAVDYDEKIREDNSKYEKDDSHEAESTVLYFKQTINNACGLYAILHAVCNGEARLWLAPNSTLDNIRQNALCSSVEETALALEDNEELERAYAEASQQGDTEAPVDPEQEVDHHYICFVKSHKNGHLYQLDGDRRQSIDLGPVPIIEDVLSDRCLDVIRGMIADEGGNMNFSLMALVHPGL
ncbi:cysteine proteinase [Ophiobolus disseminans]|uniref:Ubiquitin carboxyl-terminal hydrolase n=1 Tax=Ophiobolus disseminans TaxID=1469910 RepID=A0A6A6ZMS9_9PLEO|nr:cysteine proteinase [Ophiobolus disseminans]